MSLENNGYAQILKLLKLLIKKLRRAVDEKASYH